MTGVDYACHDHEPAEGRDWTAPRMLCIDTGVHIPELGHLTAAELRPGTPKLHRFARVGTLPDPR